MLMNLPLELLSAFREKLEELRNINENMPGVTYGFANAYSKEEYPETFREADDWLYSHKNRKKVGR
ncbi:MAG: hypothetical protein K5931_11150 [Lachnospiraceae bacterium]|nr:hypothetical protein [Lachnospiraceae bacterium]